MDELTLEQRLDEIERCLCVVVQLLTVPTIAAAQSLHTVFGPIMDRVNAREIAL